MYPPEMGPRAGPRNGAAENSAMPIPRCSAVSRSETVPPALVSGEEPKKPERARKHRIAAGLGAAMVTASQRVRKKHETR